MTRVGLLVACLLAIATSATADPISTPSYETASLVLVGLGLTSAALGLRRRRSDR